MSDLYDQLLDSVPEALRGRSGGVLLSGRSSFSGQRPLYILGLNPGGDPTGSHKSKSIQRHIDKTRKSPEHWSVFAPGGENSGKSKFHVRVHHLLKSIDASCDPCTVPTSNVVFVRSKREADLAREKDELLRLCWPIHAQVIQRLCVRVIVCLGKAAGSWVSERVQANEVVGTFEEINQRKWKSRALKAKDGICVVTVTHPSIADWTAKETDPSPLVRQCLADAVRDPSGAR